MRFLIKRGQTWIDSAADCAVHLKFADSEAINTWIALLRSYAINETYGRSLAPEDGGLYRIWRQVHLEVNQARNLGANRTFSTFSEATSQQSLSVDNGDVGSDGVDMEVSCEILINGCLCGRTTVKKCVGSPEWHEKFTFSDLPPFRELIVNIFKEKKILKPQLLGSVQIYTSNFRRGELVEGWFPVLSTGQSVSGTQVGELKLRMRVEE